MVHVKLPIGAGGAGTFFSFFFLDIINGDIVYFPQQGRCEFADFARSDEGDFP